MGTRGQRGQWGQRGQRAATRADDSIREEASDQESEREAEGGDRKGGAGRDSLQVYKLVPPGPRSTAMAEGQKRGGFKKFSKSPGDGEGGHRVLTWAAWPQRGGCTSTVTSRKREVASGNPLGMRGALGFCIPRAGSSPAADGPGAGNGTGTGLHALGASVHPVGVNPTLTPLGISAPQITPCKEHSPRCVPGGESRGWGCPGPLQVLLQQRFGMEAGGESAPMEPHSGMKRWERGAEEAVVPAGREPCSFSQFSVFPKALGLHIAGPRAEQELAFAAALHIPLPPRAAAGAVGGQPLRSPGSCARGWAKPISHGPG